MNHFSASSFSNADQSLVSTRVSNDERQEHQQWFNTLSKTLNQIDGSTAKVEQMLQEGERLFGHMPLWWIDQYLEDHLVQKLIKAGLINLALAWAKRLPPDWSYRDGIFGRSLLDTAIIKCEDCPHPNETMPALDMVRWLLDQGVDPRGDPRPVPTTWRPLQQAIMSTASAQLIPLLLERGASFDDSFGHSAVKEQEQTISQWIEEKLTYNRPNDHERIQKAWQHGLEQEHALRQAKNIRHALNDSLEHHPNKKRSKI